MHPTHPNIGRLWAWQNLRKKLDYVELFNCITQITPKPKNDHKYGNVTQGSACSWYTIKLLTGEPVMHLWNVYDTVLETKSLVGL